MIKSVFLLIVLSFACPASSENELIGGDVVDKSDYPEIVWIKSGNGKSQWSCSATVIGPQVILTAGHCVVDEGSVSPMKQRVVVDTVNYETKCRQAPLYRDKKEDHDMALCRVDRKLSVKPASISKKGPQIGDMVMLAGYGCIQPGGGGGNDGTLKVGEVAVMQLPQGTDHWFYTQGDVALCFGDSGGPSMLDEDSHMVIGVNSRGNIKDLSLLTAMFTPDSIQFMESFAQQQDVEICGVNVDCP